jgi:hypothetical protein
MCSLLQRWCLGLIVGAFALGPATGLERALHLAGAAQQHNSDSCTICQDLTIGSHADQVPVPVVVAWGNPPTTRIRPVSDHMLVIVDPCRPLIPRAPPA